MRRAAFATALVTVLGMGAWLAPAVSAAPTVAASCSDHVSGSPGGVSFTAVIRNSCRFPIRAAAVCLPLDYPLNGSFEVYGPWRYGNGTSRAVCGNFAPDLIRWGYEISENGIRYYPIGRNGPIHRVTLTAARQPSANVVPDAYGSPGFSSLTLHVTNTKGWQVRATLLCFHGVNGRRVGAWGHGPWISRPGTSTANCPFYPSDGVTAFGFDWGSPGSYQYHQIGYL
jgi:hypothetical protein